jgi:hypothetical protein
MAASPISSTETTTQPVLTDEAGLEPVDPRQSFRAALARYQTTRLVAIVEARELMSEAARPSTLATDLTAHLDSPAVVAQRIAGLAPGSRMALSLFALTETTVCSLAGLAHTLACLGVDPAPAVIPLLEQGLLALEAASDSPPIDDFARRLEQGPAHSLHLRAHPAVPRGVRVPRPEGKLASTTTLVGQIRESDGLEPILRLGAVWQRVGVEPLRQTQQGTLYKRDQERIEEDPVLSDAVSDAPESLPGLPSLWLALALRLGLLHRDPSGERIEAAGPDYWAENAFHLPQMVATSWLGLRGWRELGPGPGDPSDLGLPLAYLRPAVLLWLACLADDEWLALDDLAEHLRLLNPLWDVTSFRPELEGSSGSARRGRGRSGATDARTKNLLGSLLLGAGYTLGLVRVAEEKVTARPVVQLTSLGRYVLAMGPPPPPRPSFEHFLFVQPNLEIIAYRQGLTPQLVGRLSRFAWWTKLGAALELKLTQESIIFGLEEGLTAEQMLEVLTRHSQRALPTLVPDAIQRWTDRREQISFYTAATLMEFNSSEERDLALAAWDEAQSRTFIPVADRFLLVESADKIPTDRIRTGGSRDYRHPPEKCVSIEPDGITLTLDPTRSDLLIDAELTRIADELPVSRTLPRGSGTAPAERRYLVTAASLRRAANVGIPGSQIIEWFHRRTGGGPSPAIRLLLRSTSPTTATMTLSARRMLVLTTPTAELADGLLQHPASRDLLGARLGPTAVAVPDEHFDALRQVLVEFGLQLPPE